MSDTNPFVSSGDCYFAPGEPSDDLFIPCGNAKLGHVPCCQAGDMCLSSRACYNQQFGVTYLAGCSDEEYEDESCPDKGRLSDHPWTGLVYCNGTSNQWSPCSQSRLPETITKADDCFCPQTSRTVAFSDASVLDNVVSLPTSPGGSLMWHTGYAPTLGIAEETDTTTSTSAGGSEGPPSEPSPSAGALNEEQEEGQTGGLGTGAKAGIGVGVSAGVLILAAIALLFLKKRRAAKPAYEQSPLDAPFDAPPPTSTPSELESRAARPWSLRSELAGATPSEGASEKRGSNLRYGSAPPEVQATAPGRMGAVELPG